MDISFIRAILNDKLYDHFPQPDFEFLPDDDRDTDDLESLCVSCKVSCLWYPQVVAVNALEEFLSAPLIPRPLYIWKSALAWIKEYMRLSKRDNISSAVFIAVPLAVWFLMAIGMIPSFFHAGSFVSLVILSLISFSILFVRAYNNVISSVNTSYDPFYYERKNKENEYLQALAFHQKTAEILAESLSEYEQTGGLPSDFWCYGEEAWEYLKSGRADNLDELIPLLRRHVIEDQIIAEQTELQRKIRNVSH